MTLLIGWKSSSTPPQVEILAREDSRASIHVECEIDLCLQAREQRVGIRDDCYLLTPRRAFKEGILNDVEPFRRCLA